MSKEGGEINEVWDDFITRFPAVYDMLTHESERGSAIVSASLMDEALEQLLKAKFVPSAEKKDELFKGPYAPLEDFYAKIEFAYRMGLISVNQRTSMHLIRKLRNDFAHSSLRIDFKAQSVRNRIEELFKLNNVLLDMVGKLVKDDGNQHIMEVIGGYKSKNGVDYLSKLLGWRSTFELLCALMVAVLHIRLKSIDPLVARKDN